ncbi:unnamed protein product [Prorocentrum cordatum]|uniref:Uncharacterized protein n=1 Tax=Prorocentrum cordatum TaxID=2364126 RepID=A0ABN9US42_9DINO|nr:unnamed protein product [Polarella glacialis]
MVVRVELLLPDVLLNDARAVPVVVVSDMVLELVVPGVVRIVEVPVPVVQLSSMVFAAVPVLLALVHLVVLFGDAVQMPAVVGSEVLLSAGMLVLRAVVFPFVVVWVEVLLLDVILHGNQLVAVMVVSDVVFTAVRVPPVDIGGELLLSSICPVFETSLCGDAVLVPAELVSGVVFDVNLLVRVSQLRDVALELVLAPRAHVRHDLVHASALLNGALLVPVLLFSDVRLAT